MWNTVKCEYTNVCIDQNQHMWMLSPPVCDDCGLYVHTLLLSQLHKMSMYDISIANYQTNIVYIKELSEY